MSDFWIEMFRLLDVCFLFATTYHSQIDDQFEKTNQTLEIAFRFVIVLLNDFVDWSNVLFKLQRVLNNSVVSNDHTSNEVIYGFTSALSNLMPQSSFVVVDVVDLRTTQRIVRFEMTDVIVLNQMYSKFVYDRKHQSFYMKIDDWALLRFHKDYKISTTAHLSKKLFQQYVDFFQITEKIDRFVYRLTISDIWRVHLIFTMTQLKSMPSLSSDFFRRSRSTESNSVIVEDDIDKIKSYEIKRLLNKRQTARREMKYLVKWRDYESKHDAWRSLPELKNVMKLVHEYEEVFQQITVIQQKFFIVAAAKNQKSFAADSAERQKTALAEKELIVVKKSSAETAAEQRKIVLVRKSFAAERQKTAQPFAVIGKELIIYKKSSTKTLIERQKTAQPSAASASKSSLFAVVIPEKSFTAAADDSQLSPVTDAMILRRSSRLQNQ